LLSGVLLIFFFQAEDGIRDWSVTGVQTCALPIFAIGRPFTGEENRSGAPVAVLGEAVAKRLFSDRTPLGKNVRIGGVPYRVIGEIGRASCRERVEGGGVGGGLTKERKRREGGG